MACSWGASGYLSVCIFTLPSTPVDNILSLLQTYKLGVSNHHFVWGVIHYNFFALGLFHHLDVEMYTSSCCGHSMENAFWISILIMVGMLLDIMSHAHVVDMINAAILSVGVGASIDIALHLVVHAYVSDVFLTCKEISLIDINTHHVSWNNGELIVGTLTRDIGSSCYDFDNTCDGSRKPSVVQDTTSSFSCRNMHASSQDTTVLLCAWNCLNTNRHNISHQRNMCPLRNCGSIHASWVTIIVKTFFGTSHRDIVNHLHIIRNINARYLSILYAGLSTMSNNRYNTRCCVRSFVVDIYEHDADAQDTNTRDLFFTNSDTESFNNAQSSWFIQVDLPLDDNGVYSLRFYAGSHLVRSDIIRQDQGHMSTIRHDFNMSAFPDFCIIKQAMLKELCYDEVHNTDIRARIPTTVDVVDIHSCSDAKSCGSDKDLSEDVCDYDDTLLSRRIVRHHENQSSCGIAISVGLGRLYVQLSDV
eukprot:scaffold5037_cov113-Skeletonema_dohrnii-CCMP3373.AAC.1